MKFNISFVVDKDLVPTIAALIIDRVHNFHIEPVKSERANSHEIATPRRRGVNTNSEPMGSKIWARKVFKPIVEKMRTDPDKEWHYSEFTDVLKSNGMNGSSISPVVSEMRYLGHIVRVSKGYYKLPEAVK